MSDKKKGGNSPKFTRQIFLWLAQVNADRGLPPSATKIAVVLASAFNEDNQLQGSYGFNGKRPSIFGPGLASHLTRASGKRYVMTPSGEIGVLKRR